MRLHITVVSIIGLIAGAAAYVALAMALVLFVVGCTVQPVPVDPPLPPSGCARVCERLAELKCPEAEPTPEGQTCEQVCDNVQASGIVQLNTGCIANAASCDAALECQ